MILHLDRDILTVGLEQVSLSGAERCVYRTAALHDAGAAEDKGLVRGGGAPPAMAAPATAAI